MKRREFFKLLAACFAGGTVGYSLPTKAKSDDGLSLRNTSYNPSKFEIDHDAKTISLRDPDGEFSVEELHAEIRADMEARLKRLEEGSFWFQVRFE